jgi:hypothetical protein
LAENTEIRERAAPAENAFVESPVEADTIETSLAASSEELELGNAALPEVTAQSSAAETAE